MASKKGKAQAASDAKTDSTTVAQTFAVQSLHDQVLTYQQRVSTLSSENDQLKLAQKKSERSTHEFVAYFQHELESKQDLVQQLTEQLASEKKALEYERSVVQANLSAQLEALRLDTSETERHLKFQLSEAQEDLVKLRHFRDLKLELENQISNMTVEHSAAKTSFEDKYAALERKLLEDRAKSAKEMERRIHKIKVNSRLEAREGLDADSRRILADNQRMAEELQFQLQMTQELESEMELLTKKNKELKMEVELGQEKDIQVARKSQGQQRELREIEDQTLDTEGLKRLLKIKSKELKTMKHLAQTILDQRSDVEHFFLESLALVKDEILQEKKQSQAQMQAEYRKNVQSGTIVNYHKARKQPPPKSTRLPETTTSKVDVGELSWEDRERVLRLLFSRINHAQDLLVAAEEDSSVFITTSKELKDRVLE